MSMPAGYNFLVFDDNPGDLSLIREAIVECRGPYHLTCATSVQEALGILPAGTFDLVFSDMGTAGAGLAIVRAIRADPRLKATPVIVLSGMLDVMPAYEAGANAFVSKGNDFDTLVNRIKEILHFWIKVAELPEPVEPSNAGTPQSISFSCPS